MYSRRCLFAATLLLRRGTFPSSTSSCGTADQKNIAGNAPNHKNRKSKSPGSWSIWGESDRVNDTQFHSTKPLPYSSPFQKIRQQQQQYVAAGAAAATGAGARGALSSSAAAASTTRTTSSSSTSSSSSPTHLYANKENAWEHYTDDRYYGARRFKEYYSRMVKDRGVRYYFLGVLLLMVGAAAKLYQLEREQRATEGLLGPKKKAYRSRLTVVLDVDETIVSFGDKAYRMKAGLVARPYLAELLDYLSEIDAEVVLWSACSERYMRQVLSVIDPTGVRVSQYITRHKDWFSSDHYYEKNLLWLKRDLKDVLFLENRALSVRNCNANSILVDDFIRGEYMDTGQDHPHNDQALRYAKEIIEALHTSGKPVPEYLCDTAHRHAAIQEIPCHYAIRQLPEELARGVFFFLGDKYKWSPDRQEQPPSSAAASSKTK